MLRIAVPDLVSNSYFPIIAAVELGFFEQEGFDASVDLFQVVLGVPQFVAAGIGGWLLWRAHVRR